MTNSSITRKTIPEEMQNAYKQTQNPIKLQRAIKKQNCILLLRPRLINCPQSAQIALCFWASGKLLLVAEGQCSVLHPYYH